MAASDDDRGRGAADPSAAPRSSAEAATPVHRMEAGFAAALASGAPVREETYAFAGRPVRMRVVGARLAERTHRAFAHLKRSGEPTAAGAHAIDLWDEAETGVPSPLADESGSDRQWIACDGTLTSSPDGRYVAFRYQDSVTVLDRAGRRMIGCRQNGSHLSRGECSKPFVLLLSVWCHDRGVQVVHAGLVARGGAGVLLPGESGTGKSTTSLSAVSQGLEYLGDDFVGLERTGDGAFLGHSLYDTACLARENLGRFPEIEPRAVEDRFPEEEKPILFLSEIYPHLLRATVPIRAMALIRIGNDRTTIRRASRGEALRHFAASTLHTVVPRPGRDALAMMAELVERVPAYWLLLGPDPRDVPGSIERVLSDGGGTDVT